jgi:hypothetical protein
MKFIININTILPAIAMYFLCINLEANGQSPTSTIKDRNGNSYTIKIFPDNKTWMTANLNYINIPGSYCYADSAQYCKQYGRLYTWKAALLKLSQL